MIDFIAYFPRDTQNSLVAGVVCKIICNQGGIVIRFFEE